MRDSSIVPCQGLSGLRGRTNLARAVALAILAMSSAFAAHADEGTSCEEPLFSVSWDSFHIAKLDVASNADDAQAFWVFVKYLNGNGGHRPILENVPRVPNNLCGAPPPADPTETSFCILSAPGGSTALLKLNRNDLLSHAGGWLGLRYEAADQAGTCPERRSGPVNPQCDRWSTAGKPSADGKWRPGFLSGADIRYSAIGAIDEHASDEAADPGSGDGGEPADEEPFNPLAAGGGVLEANVFGSLNLLPRFAIATGFGFTTVPGEAGSELETKTKYYVALRGEVEGYNAGQPADSLAGSSSWAQAGTMNNDLFEAVVLETATDTTPAVLSDESKRYFLEGEVELPRVGTEWLRILVRLYASVPTSGDGPSDVRVSALASVDPRKWFGGVGKRE